MKTLKIVVTCILALAVGWACAASEADDTELFPAPLPGWTAERVRSQVIERPEPSLGTSMRLAKDYRNPRTKCLVRIQIDSGDLLTSSVVENVYSEGADKLPTDFRPYAFAGLRGIESGPPGEPDFVALELRLAKIVSIRRTYGSTTDMQRYLANIDFQAIDRWRPAKGGHVPLPLIDVKD
jgi:hypothetical protein